MVARVLFVVAVALTSAACSDNREENLARCKAKAIELYHPPADEREWKREPLIYVHECMMASGYRLNTKKRDCMKVAAAAMPSCWYPEK